MTLKKLREKAHLTQKGLAALAGLNVSQVQKLEYGVIKIENITLGSALGLCGALGITAKELYNHLHNETEDD